MDLTQYIQVIIDKHKEFSEAEVQDLCDEYLKQFNAKTKESSKLRSLLKYLSKEFGVSFETEGEDEEDGEKAKLTAFSSIPKVFFQISNSKNADYILQIKELNKQLGSTILFENADLKIKAGDKIALIGKNGAGKSTLLKMIIDEEDADLGDIEILKNMKIGFLSQDLFWNSRENIVKEEMLTALPDITRNMHRLQDIDILIAQGHEDSVELLEEQAELIEWMIHNNGYQKYALQVEVLKYFGFSPQQLNFKIAQLSGGEQTKIQIAKFLVQEVDLLILDEPTNHLDIEGIVFLEQFCKLRGKSLICISHDKKFLNTVFEKVVEISNKKLYTYYGNYDKYIEQKQKNYETQVKDYVSQQKELEHQQKFIDRFRYQASKAASVQSRIKMLDKIERLELPENESTVKNISFKLEDRLPQVIIEMENISVGYGAEVLINLPPKLQVNKEMKIGIIGKNGVGKTTLLKTILGEISAVYGGVTINEKLKVGSYSQVADELNFDNTIVEELIGPGVSQRQVRSILGALLISNEKMDQKIATLSGGERSKVALTKMLLGKPHVIIMDEPTNHLDIPSKDAIKKMLQDFDGVSIIVSHDRDFLEGTSNLLRVVKDGQLTVFHSLDRGFQEMEVKGGR